MQRTLALFDLGAWDSRPYLQFLLSVAQTQLEFVVTSALLSSLGQGAPPPIIGSHIRKGKNLARSLANYAQTFPEHPCQVFISRSQGRITDTAHAKLRHDIPEAANIVAGLNLSVFIHAPYIINLCANACDETPQGTVYWQQDLINSQLTYGVQLGAKGVVVHTGARTHRPVIVAKITMYSMVKAALAFATPECPLLLETPCGEGTEICWRIEDLGNFFLMFSEAERTKLGLCVDTCHVFAAGYDPVDYLKHWDEHVPVKIHLVHYNDSLHPHGSHKDKHMPAGTGYIGTARMQAVAEWCQERNIAMVTE
jgi:deoxyribonuclease-4